MTPLTRSRCWASPRGWSTRASGKGSVGGEKSQPRPSSAPSRAPVLKSNSMDSCASSQPRAWQAASSLTSRLLPHHSPRESPPPGVFPPVLALDFLPTPRSLLRRRLAVGRQAWRPLRTQPAFPQGVEGSPWLVVSTSDTPQIWLVAGGPLNQGKATWWLKGESSPQRSLTPLHA